MSALGAGSPWGFLRVAAFALLGKQCGRNRNQREAGEHEGDRAHGVSGYNRSVRPSVRHQLVTGNPSISAGR